MSERDKLGSNDSGIPLLDVKKYVDRVKDKLKARGLIRLSEEDMENIKSLDEALEHLSQASEAQKALSLEISRQKNVIMKLETEILSHKIKSQLQKDNESVLNIAQSILGKVLYSERFIGTTMRSEISNALDKIKNR